MALGSLLIASAAPALAAPPPDLADVPLFRRTGGVILARGAGIPVKYVMT